MRFNSVMKWVFILMIVCSCPVAAAEETMLPDLTLLENAVTELDRALDGVFSLEDMYRSILNGEFDFDISLILEWIVSLLLGEIKTFSSLLSQLLMLGLFSAVLSVFADSFEGTASKVGHWVIFLAFLLVAIKNFNLALDIGTTAIGQAADFLYAVMPVLLSSFALSGSVVAASVVQPMVLMVISLFLGMMERFFLPLLLVMAALTVCSHLSPRYSFGKFSELLRSIIMISLGFLMTVFIGVLSLSGFASGTADGLGMKTVKMAAGNFIPLVGGYISDAFDSILGAGLLLRSSIGIFGVIAIGVVLIAPSLEILVMSFLFRFSAAVLQPFGDNTLVDSLSDLSSVLLVLFALVAAAGLLFFFLIFCIVGVSSMTMMFR